MSRVEKKIMIILEVL